MVVTVSFTMEDYYYEISEEDLATLLHKPISDRRRWFFDHAQSTAIRCSNESSWDYDMSGNQTDENFWTGEDGETALRDLLELEEDPEDEMKEEEVSVPLVRVVTPPVVTTSELRISKENVGGLTIVRPRGFLQSDTYAQMEAFLRECLRLGEVQLVMDMKEVGYLGSAGAGALLGLLPDFQRGGGDITLLNLEGNAREVMDLLGMIGIFRCVDTLDDLRGNVYA